MTESMNNQAKAVTPTEEQILEASRAVIAFYKQHCISNGIEPTPAAVLLAFYSMHHLEIDALALRSLN